MTRFGTVTTFVIVTFFVTVTPFVIVQLSKNAVVTPDAAVQGSFFRGAHAVEEQIRGGLRYSISSGFIAFEIASHHV